MHASQRIFSASWRDGVSTACGGLLTGAASMPANTGACIGRNAAARKASANGTTAFCM
jgi:hypothetical protein